MLNISLSCALLQATIRPLSGRPGQNSSRKGVLLVSSRLVLRSCLSSRDGATWAELDDDDTVEMVVEAWLAETGGAGGPTAVPTLLVAARDGTAPVTLRPPPTLPRGPVPAPTPAPAPAPRTPTPVPASALAAPAPATEELAVGSSVRLAPGFASVADASRGCLKPGDVGEVVEVKASVNLGEGYQGVRGFRVRANGSTWCAPRPSLFHAYILESVHERDSEPGGGAPRSAGLPSAGQRQHVVRSQALPLI